MQPKIIAIIIAVVLAASALHIWIITSVMGLSLFDPTALFISLGLAVVVRFAVRRWYLKV